MQADNLKDSSGLSQACIISAASPEAGLKAARQRAMALLCSGEGPRPCGHCRSCRKALSGIHPDIITVGRLSDDKGRLRKEISVDQVRLMRSDACVLPNESGRKVYIIDRADCMNIPAQNAALKLLEEPPNGAVFLLCVVSAQQLLPTVRSRCSELIVGGDREKQESGEFKLAEEYLKTVSAGSRSKLLLWCGKNEGMDGRSAAAFIDAVLELIGDMLCGRRARLGFSDAQLIKLTELCRRAEKYLSVNVGAKHIFGLLAVDSIAGAKKEETN